MENARTAQPMVTARSAGLVGCPNCGRVHDVPAPGRCQRCGWRLPGHAPDRSLQRVWAWLLAGLVVYIPANIYPMLRTNTFGRTTESTILEGVVDLIHHGSYGVALVVFVASIVIPIGKFFAIAYLAISVERREMMQVHARHRLFEVVEFIGRWSMIDVFVVAILAALVQLDFAATINPGIAAISFALSVAFTMLSAQSFDPKTIWLDGDMRPR
ncbi:paraquat-inducible protein A [Rhodophyticola porphyridii]|uniref:Paraquat-inducible membrane protein A n=1 Tax=Rhodophyticola porphyridii TaxID=1852017 RepID=A0A3L9Y1Q8_9RHOB|nr:paraquat-inducible protein A [Rhodophyticola porphyridii]RMA41158.1 paraquat-inducible membrane protein A [Rhodophyticola porphyridii]